MLSYRNVQIAPKYDFGDDGFLIDGIKVRHGFVCIADGCNILPGATWAETIDCAKRLIDAYFASNGEADIFWKIVRDADPAQHAKEQEEAAKMRSMACQAKVMWPPEFQISSGYNCGGLAPFSQHHKYCPNRNSALAEYRLSTELALEHDPEPDAILPKRKAALPQLSAEERARLDDMAARSAAFCAEARRVGTAICDVHGDIELATNVNTYSTRSGHDRIVLCNAEDERLNALISNLPLWRDEDLPTLLPLLAKMYLRERKLDLQGEENHLPGSPSSGFNYIIEKWSKKKHATTP